MASVDYDPVTGLERRRSIWTRLALPLTAFVLGLAAMGWMLARWQTAALFLGVAPEPTPPAPVVRPAPEPATVQPQVQAPPAPLAEGEQRLVIDPETQRRVTRLEQRLGELDNASRAAVGNADRAEGLL
ncbi:MAG: hypothetical protein QOI38_1017, partial [Sphingomonadales bacterium]|nr:hypothetical protein [Sphingomonadales bacterium]